MRWQLLIALSVGSACAHASAEPRYYARYAEPCGLATLEISQNPEGPFRLVYARGESPARRLRYHALINARVIVTGPLTGAMHEDAECGALPELQVVDFAPWGPVNRVFSHAALDGQLQRYTEELPRDRFAAADFEGGPELPLLDGDACRPTTAPSCPAGTVKQTDISEGALCCPILR